MKRTTHNFAPGTPEWHQHRAGCFNASDAAAMLEMSKYQSRAELLRQAATGFRPDVSDATQRIFDAGHQHEAAIRPLAESIIGEELLTPIMSVEIDGLRLSASFDGLTIADDVAWEHKTLNKELEASLAQGIIPVQYHPQLEQQLLVSGADRVLFTASRGTEDTAAHAWYESNPKLREQLVAGWKQFAKDVAAYVPEAPTVEAVGRAPETLPALRIEVTGAVTASNLADFKATAFAVINAIRDDLQTDEDFADAEKAVKWCGDVEKRLAAAKEAALAQTADIDLLFRTIDDISAEARTKRLNLDKLVKARKEGVRVEIQQAALAQVQAHIKAIDARLGNAYLPVIPHDIAGAMKGKKTIASLKDGAAGAVAAWKIEADRVAGIIEKNLETLDANHEHRFLFNDKQALVLKDPEAVAAIVAQRIAQHEADQKRQAEEAAEREREKIRAEEQAKAQAEAKAREAAERAEREKAEREASARVEAEEAARITADVQARQQEARKRPVVDQTIRNTESVSPAITKRPTDAQIALAVATAFNVDAETAIHWLRAMHPAALTALDVQQAA